MNFTLSFQRKSLPAKSEKEIFDILGVPYFPPEERNCWLPYFSKPSYLTPLGDWASVCLIIIFSISLPSLVISMLEFEGQVTVTKKINGDYRYDYFEIHPHTHAKYVFIFKIRMVMHDLHNQCMFIKFCRLVIHYHFIIDEHNLTPSK